MLIKQSTVANVEGEQLGHVDTTSSSLPSSDVLHSTISVSGESNKCLYCHEEMSDRFFLGCGCPPNRHKTCVSRAILSNIEPRINSRRKMAPLRAKCDICHRNIPMRFLKEISLPTSVEALVKSSQEDESPNEGAMKHNGLKAFAWMELDLKWVEIKVFEYKTPLQRTSEKRAFGGPIYKRGEYRYTFLVDGEETSDYFSEGDSTIGNFFVDDDDVVEAPKGAPKGGPKGRRKGADSNVVIFFPIYHCILGNMIKKFCC